MSVFNLHIRMLYVTIERRKFFVWIIIPVLHVFTVMLWPSSVDNGKCTKPDTTSDESDYHVISSHLYCVNIDWLVAFYLMFHFH